MNIPHALSLVIQRSHSLAEILDSTVQIVAEEFGADVCSIYLLDPGSRRLRLTATHGLDKSAIGKVTLDPGQGLTGIVVAEMRALAVDDGSSHPGYLYFPETREERYKSFLGVPMALRNRPVGAIVVQTTDERQYSTENTQTLYTIAAQLVGVVENARLIEALDRGDEGSKYLNEVRSWHSREASIRGKSRIDLYLSGSAASPGIAMAEAVVRGSHDDKLDEQPEEFQGDDAEQSRVREALEKTRADLLKIQKRAESETDEEHALIFSSHLLLLNDPVLLSRIDQVIATGVTAPKAVYRALGEFGARLKNVSDPYIQDRVEDIMDLRSRIVGHLLFGDAYTPNVNERIVVTRGTPPSLVVELKAKGAQALITEIGGATSHGALLARSMGVPAVTGVQNVTNVVRTGDRVIVDGHRGTIVLNPSQKVVKTYEDRARRLHEQSVASLKYCNLPARTGDGRKIMVLANIGVAADLPVAKQNGADGIGLYRTEFPFIIREHFPTREEQIRIYRQAYTTFDDAPILFRLLDLGGDKFAPGSSIRTDRDPFQGYRSIRVLLDHPSVLSKQVQAFALAAAGRPLSILIPMISTVNELRRVKELIREALDQLSTVTARVEPRIGVMIELPAAVEISDSLAKQVDFLSIGTNDLIQYALAIDRENSRVASARDPYHPAILRMVHRTILAAHREGKPVSVCGELASDWRLALILIAMGVDSLSVSPNSILELKKSLASSEVGPVEGSLDRLLGLADATDIENELTALLPDREEEAQKAANGKLQTEN